MDKDFINGVIKHISSNKIFEYIGYNETKIKNNSFGGVIGEPFLVDFRPIDADETNFLTKAGQNRPHLLWVGDF